MVIMVLNNLGEFMSIQISPKEYERQLNWNDAKLYCDLLIIDGIMDWRLPTRAQLKAMYNSDHDFDGLYYWSSTEHDDKYAWIQNMAGGNWQFRHNSNIYYVRAVRTKSKDHP